MNICKLTRLSGFPFAVAIAFAAAASAQVRVVGTGNPDIDVPAVQDAVNQGGQVILKGHFSFDAAPTITPDLPGLPLSTVLVSKAITISGAADDDDDMATIEGGQVPFEVEAPGSAVTIERLRFVKPTYAAIDVSAVSGLLIASCRIEGLHPLNNLSNGISITTTSGLPSPGQPGKPERISGTLLIVDNDIDVVGATALDNALGIVLFSLGVPGAEVDAYVSGNRIRNVTEPAINFRRLVGRAFIDRNDLRTADFAGAAAEVIRVVNLGSYLIARNSIDCRWPQGVGIGVFSQFAAWPITGALVTDNAVTMAPPGGTVSGADSAGISVRGFAQGNVALGNSIRGRAAKALSVTDFRGGTPSDTAFVLNRLHDFEASLADVFIDAGVLNTHIVGEGSVEDHGTGTLIVRLPAPGPERARHPRGDEKEAL